MQHAYAPDRKAAYMPTGVAARAGAPRVFLPAQGPQLVRWGSIFSGTLISVASFALLTALWLALSFGSHVSFVYSNLSWWIGGTAIACMFVAGLIAGMTAGARGIGAGSVNGITTWALVVISVGALVLPTFAIGRVPNTVVVSGHVYSINYLTYWTTFWSLLIGLGAALLGGIIGGALHRSVDEPYIDVTDDAAAPAPVVAAPVPAAGAAPTTGGATMPSAPVAGTPVAGGPVVDQNGREVYAQQR